MTDREAVDRFVAEMRGRGVGPWTSAPPLFRLFWLLGMKVPPPLFLPSRMLARLLGGYFALFMLVFLSVMEWRRDHPLTAGGIVGSVVGAAVGGALFGLWMAWYIDRKRRALKLPSWDKYLADGSSLSGESGAHGSPGKA